MTAHDDKKLSQLSQLAMPEPTDAARRRALDAALLAFDAAQADAEKSSDAPQGRNWGARLRSIIPQRSWIMDTRITLGFGTAAVALLLLPLGYQLYSSTAITPVAIPATVELKQQPGQFSVGQDVGAMQQEVLAEAAPVVPTERTEAGTDGLANDVGAASVLAQKSAAPSPRTSMAIEPFAAAQSAASGAVSDMEMAVGMPAPMAMAPTEPSGDSFSSFDESPVKVVQNEPVSTFSIDVDTAAYSYVRQALNDGWMPEPDAVRIEEMINYFNYAYPAPDSLQTPFKTTLQVYPTPWNAKTQLLQIGIKGYVPPLTEDKPSNLVFLLDTSGSMDEPDKLPLLKRAFALLVDQLSSNDTVSIVAYAGSAGVVLEPTKASDKAKILAALENLSAGGSTAGAEGIELAYRLAEENKVDGINRVILATDGDFNVGIEGPEDLKTFIKSKRDAGVSLSVLGFGQGNLGDDTMQALAQNGNGNVSYIDSFREAQKVLVQEMGGTLETIAKDVKIQVEFNPAVVAEYRLVGYETRALNREDFNNDKVDAGDIGAGHTVTAIYEITPVGSGAALNDPLRYGSDTPATAVLPSDEIGFLKMRYKAPDGETSKLIETPITKSLAVESLAAASDDSRWAAAVAAFAQKLKGSSYGEMTYAQIKALAQGARGADENGYRAEFMQLINSAAIISGQD